MEEFKIVAKFNTVIEAEIFQLVLEAEQISSVVLDANLSFTLGPTSIQGIRLQVKSEDYSKALAIYQNWLDNSSNDLDYQEN